MKMNKLSLLGLAAAMLLSVTALANTSLQSTPITGKGRKVYQTQYYLDIQPVMEVGFADTSLGIGVASILSGTSKLLCNVTSTAGLSPTGTTPYMGTFRVWVLNTSGNDMVVFPTAVSYTVTSANPSGKRIAAGTGDFLDVPAVDGYCVQGQGVTATCSANVSVSNK